MTFQQYKLQILEDPRSNKLNFNIDGREHYVYRVTDYTRTINQHYYGAHTPSKDKKYNNLIEEFWTYKTSSKYNSLNEKTKENYKVKIVMIFNNSADKIIFESYIHHHFNVKNSNYFWNRVNALPWGFDRTGCKNSDEQKLKSSLAQKGIKKPGAGKHLFNDDGTLKQTIYDKMCAYQKETPSMLNKKQSEHQKIVASETHKGKIISDEQILKTLNSEGYKNRKSPSESLKKWHKNNISKSQKKYVFYNKFGEEIIKLEDKSFKKFCAEHNLPVTAFYKSYREGGSKLYQTSYSLNRVKKKGWDIYEGWFCKELDSSK